MKLGKNNAEAIVYRDVILLAYSQALATRQKQRHSDGVDAQV